MQHLLFRFRVALVITATIALATNALAQATVVIGTGNPAADVPAVQAAVNLGGDVVLMGHFSFDTQPTVPTALQAVGIHGIEALSVLPLLFHAFAPLS